MNDEKTIYDDEKVKYQSQETTTGETKPELVTDRNKVPNKKPMWKRAAIGAGTGFAAGVAATVLTSGTTEAQAQTQEQDDIISGGESHPEWVDGEVQVATNVNDNMSFGEAFAAARAEVGAGGVFEWHGGIYNTYYEDEWANMSAAERAEYGSHFSWNEHHNDYTANHQTTNTTGHEEVIAAVVDNQPTKPTVDDVPSVVVGDEVESHTIDDAIVHTNLVGAEEEHEVEILGVVHDDDSGANIGGLMIDGHEAVVIDVNGDMTFEAMGIDLNDNHEFEENEQADISQYGLTVDEFNSQVGDNGDDATIDTGGLEGA